MPLRWLRNTYIARRIHLVANSGRQQEICAFKIWRERMSLDFPSLYLESTVLHALSSERFGQLAENFLAVLVFGLLRVFNSYSFTLHTFNSTRVAPPPPSFCGASTTDVTWGCC